MNMEAIAEPHAHGVEHQKLEDTLKNMNLA
ncbi:hypothetical protein CEXT_437761, partial [Caerostris extrusa]